MGMWIEMHAEVSDALASGILTTAWESGFDGIGYWASARASERDAEGNVIALRGVHDCEDEQAWEPLDIDCETVARGVRIVLAEPVQTSFQQRVASAVIESDAGRLDSDDADRIVQLGLFGEVMYG